MRWSGFGLYAQSDKGYRVSKGYIGIDQPKYVAYGPDGTLLDVPAFYKYSEARDACEDHYNETFKQAEEDMF